MLTFGVLQTAQFHIRYELECCSKHCKHVTFQEPFKSTHNELITASNAEQFYFSFFHGKIKGNCISAGASLMIKSFSSGGKRVGVQHRLKLHRVSTWKIPHRLNQQSWWPIFNVCFMETHRKALVNSGSIATPQQYLLWIVKIQSAENLPSLLQSLFILGTRERCKPAVCPFSMTAPRFPSTPGRCFLFSLLNGAHSSLDAAKTLQYWQRLIPVQGLQMSGYRHQVFVTSGSHRCIPQHGYIKKGDRIIYH